MLAYYLGDKLQCQRDFKILRINCKWTGVMENTLTVDMTQIYYLHSSEFSSPRTLNIRTFHPEIQNFAMTSDIWKYLTTQTQAYSWSIHSNQVSGYTDVNIIMLNYDLYTLRGRLGGLETRQKENEILSEKKENERNAVSFCLQHTKIGQSLNGLAC